MLSASCLFVILTLCFGLKLQPFSKRADLDLIEHTTSTLLSAQNDKALRCCENVQFCHAKDALIYYKKLIKLKRTTGYVIEDVYKMNLISWYNELHQHIVSDVPDKGSCVSKRENVLLVKIDLLNNLYHHMGTLLNAYISKQIVLQLLPSAKDELTVVLWDASLSHSNNAIVKFLPLWRALLGDVILAGDLTDTVCIKELFLGLPPRRWDGLIYNAILPDIPAQGSGLLQQFASEVLSSLHIPFSPPPANTVLWITRSTNTRRVLNEEQIVSVLRDRGYNVTVVDLAILSLTAQLTLVTQHGVLVGLHGAGLTHVMFCKGCVLVELFNCGEEACYRDLAALSSSHYLTLPRRSVQPSYTKPSRSPKDADYTLNVASVISLVQEAVNWLRVRDEL